MSKKDSKNSSKLRFIIEIVFFAALFLGVFANKDLENLTENLRADQSHLNKILDLTLEQYNYMYMHQGRRGGNGKWSNAIGGLPSPRIAKKYVISFLQSEPSELLFGEISVTSYIRMCMNIINTFPKIQNGSGGGILIAIHSYQEDEHNIVLGFCTEAGNMYFFNKEMESMIRESSKPNSLIPAFFKGAFDKYEPGGNWNDFVENCEDILIKLKKKHSKRDPESKWVKIGIPEISDFCEEVSDDIYPNTIADEGEWSHIYNLQNYILERKGKMGVPILGIPKKRPPYYVAGRHQSSMYRKCLRALWDMFQYDEDVNLKIAGKNQYETLRSFCDAAKNYYTRSGRISAYPMIQIDETPRKRPIRKQEKGQLVKQILEEQRRRDLKEKEVASKLKRKFSDSRYEKIKRQRKLRDQTRMEEKKKEEERPSPEFPTDGIFSPEIPSPTQIQTQDSKVISHTHNLPSTSFQEESIVDYFDPVNQSENSEDQYTSFGIETAQEELDNLGIND
ncbi:hypothetical protein FG386_002087 [Cryptosporidium ryanae]|uniref:uncharacterized protein n=1 Tax=Cryptosporidium ryanae TaxID=515981 RepID=UPI00351A781A|nr:hypothetical protein FG386_002087 [Cryptosporidium ryanae]